MGLESHIDRELQRAATGLVRGEDYWFYDGLRVEREDKGKELVAALDESGEFGPARLTIVNKEEEKKFPSLYGTWKIEFGIHRNHWHHPQDEYNIYYRQFKAGVEDAE